MGAVLSKDHVGAPPFVVLSTKMRSHREPFSFLVYLSPTIIVLPFAVLVNLRSEAARSTPRAGPSLLRGSSSTATTLRPVPQSFRPVCPTSAPISPKRVAYESYRCSEATSYVPNADLEEEYRERQEDLREGIQGRGEKR